MANEKFGLLNAKEEGTRLKSEIVESPEKLQVGFCPHLWLIDTEYADMEVDAEL